MRWSEHVSTINNDRITKRGLFGKLSEGRRERDRPHLHSDDLFLLESQEIKSCGRLD